MCLEGNFTNTEVQYIVQTCWISWYLSVTCMMTQVMRAQARLCIDEMIKSESEEVGCHTLKKPQTTSHHHRNIDVNTNMKTGASFHCLYCEWTVCRQGKTLSVWVIQSVLYAWFPIPTTTAPHYCSMATVCVPRVVWIYIANVSRYHCFWEGISLELEHPLIISALYPETKFSRLSFLRLSHSHNSTLFNLIPHPLFSHLCCLFPFLVSSWVHQSSMLFTF